MEAEPPELSAVFQRLHPPCQLNILVCLHPFEACHDASFPQPVPRSWLANSQGRIGMPGNIATACSIGPDPSQFYFQLRRKPAYCRRASGPCHVFSGLGSATITVLESYSGARSRTTSLIQSVMPGPWVAMKMKLASLCLQPQELEVADFPCSSGTVPQSSQSVGGKSVSTTGWKRN